MRYGRSSEDSIFWDTAAPGRRHRSLAVCGLSDTPQGLSGREASGAEGREQPCDGTYHKGGAKSPGPGQSGDDDGPVLGGGIDGGGKHTGSDTDDAAEEGEQDSFEEELDADVALGGTQRPAQPDLGAALKHRDDHDVGHADGADEQGHGPEAEEEAVEGGLGVGLGDQGGGGLAHVDLVGSLGIGGGG